MNSHFSRNNAEGSSTTARFGALQMHVLAKQSFALSWGKSHNSNPCRRILPWSW
jgi:hypothetical protein